MAKVNEAGTLIVPLISQDTANVDANYGPWVSIEEYVGWLNSKANPGATIEPLVGTLIAITDNDEVKLKVFQADGQWKSVGMDEIKDDLDALSQKVEGIDDKVTTAESAATNAAASATKAETEATKAANTLVGLNNTLQNLPDGQAVSAQVAVNRVKISDLEKEVIGNGLVITHGSFSVSAGVSVTEKESVNFINYDESVLPSGTKAKLRLDFPVGVFTDNKVDVYICNGGVNLSNKVTIDRGTEYGQRESDHGIPLKSGQEIEITCSTSDIDRISFYRIGTAVLSDGEIQITIRIGDADDSLNGKIGVLSDRINELEKEQVASNMNIAELSSFVYCEPYIKELSAQVDSSGKYHNNADYRSKIIPINGTKLTVTANDRQNAKVIFLDDVVYNANNEITGVVATQQTDIEKVVPKTKTAIFDIPNTTKYVYVLYTYKTNASYKPYGLSVDGVSLFDDIKKNIGNIHELLNTKSVIYINEDCLQEGGNVPLSYNSINGRYVLQEVYSPKTLVVNEGFVKVRIHKASIFYGSQKYYNGIQIYDGAADASTAEPIISILEKYDTEEEALANISPYMTNGIDHAYIDFTHITNYMFFNTKLNYDVRDYLNSPVIASNLGLSSSTNSNKFGYSLKLKDDYVVVYKNGLKCKKSLYTIDKEKHLIVFKEPLSIGDCVSLNYVTEAKSESYALNLDDVDDGIYNQFNKGMLFNTENTSPVSLQISTDGDNNKCVVFDNTNESTPTTKCRFQFEKTNNKILGNRVICEDSVKIFIPRSSLELLRQYSQEGKKIDWFTFSEWWFDEEYSRLTLEINADAGGDMFWKITTQSFEDNYPPNSGRVQLPIQKHTLSTSDVAIPVDEWFELKTYVSSGLNGVCRISIVVDGVEKNIFDLEMSNCFIGHLYDNRFDYNIRLKSNIKLYFAIELREWLHNKMLDGHPFRVLWKDLVCKDYYQQSN